MTRVPSLLGLACLIGAASVHTLAARPGMRSAECEPQFIEAASPLAPTLAITIL
jgi:hypothetical protein